MRQGKKPEKSVSRNTTKNRKSVNAVFDEFFCKDDKPRPTPGAQKLEYAKTELASAAIKERISETFRKTHFAEGKKEIKEIPFEGGRFKIVRKLSSEENIAGDVYLAEKITTKNGTEYPGELVVLKMLKNEEEILKNLELDAAGREYLIKRLFMEAGMEINNLNRLNHLNIVSSTGDIVLFYPDGKESRTENARLVSQMEYIPHAINDYLWSVEGETRLTNDVLEAGIQILDAISYLEDYRSEEAPQGLVHNDFKLGNMGAVLKDGKLVVKMLDLDSIRPIAKLVSARKEMKYSPDHCDPEEFMEFHNNEITTNVKPAETIYPLGMALLYSIAERMCVPLDNRKLIVIGQAYREEVESVPTVRSTLIPGLSETIERTTRVSVIDPERLKKSLEEAREIDECNLIRVYLANEKRGKALGRASETPPEIEKLLEKYEYVIKADIEPEIKRETKWAGDRRLSFDEIEKMSQNVIVEHFKRLLSDFKADKRVEDRCNAENEHEKIMFGIEYNVRRLTEEYARNNYRWYLSAQSHFSKSYKWYDALNGMLIEIVGLSRDEAAEVVELTKKEEKGRNIESVFHPEVFEAIAYCLKLRAERPDAKSMKKIFESKKIEAAGDFPEVSEGDE